MMFDRSQAPSVDCDRSLRGIMQEIAQRAIG